MARLLTVLFLVSGLTAHVAAQAQSPDDVLTFEVGLTAAEVVTGSSSPGSAAADVGIRTADGAVSGDVELVDLEATSVSLNRGFAGAVGPPVINLEAATPDRWTFPATATLSAAELDAARAGGLFLHVVTAAAPEGALRGQLVPDGIEVAFTRLSGAQEVPSVDTAASAMGALTLDTASGAIVAHVNGTGLDDATQAHIHQALAGVNGPILVDLVQHPENVSRWLVEDAVLDEAGLAAFRAGELYFNVHTPANPAGEVRGQIAPEGIQVIFARLTGEQEVPPVATEATAIGALTLDTASGAIVAHVNGTGLDDATQAHVHRAVAGVNGPILVDLAQDPNDPAHWLVEDAVLDEAGLAALNVGELYFNVHTPANPAGEVRGQIVPRGVRVVFTRLSGEEEVPPVATTADGLGALTLIEENGAVVAHVRTTGLDDAVEAHIHQAIAGVNGPILVDLVQDPDDPAHWLIEDGALDEAGMAAFHGGALYFNVHTPAHPAGEARGQILPEGAEVFRADLTGGAVVPPVTTTGSGTMTATLLTGPPALSMHVRLVNLGDAQAVAVHQAPASENGPEVLTLAQDPDDPAHWFLEGAALDASVLQALRDQALYVIVRTPAFPEGAVRGQMTAGEPTTTPVVPGRPITY